MRLTIRLTFAALFMHIRSAIHACESDANAPFRHLTCLTEKENEQ
jgi:hypothetical protein